MFSNLMAIFVTVCLIGLTKNILSSKMVFKTGDCKYSRDQFSNFTLKIVNGKLQMDMMLIKSLLVGFKAHLTFEFRLAKAKSYQSLFQHNVNYCGLLDGHQDSIYRRWALTMLKSGNFATSCPIAPGYYYLKGWSFDGKMVPTFFYLGDYKISATFFYGRYRKTDDKSLLECAVEAILVN